MGMNDSVRIDFASLSDEGLIEVIDSLRGSPYSAQLEGARKELVARLKDMGYDNDKIARLLTGNVYGRKNRMQIAKDWHGVLEISLEEFLSIIGAR